VMREKNGFPFTHFNNAYCPTIAQENLKGLNRLFLYLAVACP